MYSVSCWIPSLQKQCNRRKGGKKGTSQWRIISFPPAKGQRENIPFYSQKLCGIVLRQTLTINYWNSISLSSRKPMRMNLRWQLRTSQGRHPYLIPGLLSSHPGMRYSTSQQIQLLQMVPHKLVRWSQLLLLGHFWTMFSQVSQQAVMLIAIYTFIYRLRDSWGDCFLQNKLKLCNNELLLWNFSYQPLMRNRFLLW